MNQFAEIITEVSTVSSADTRAVMEAMVSRIPRQLAPGNLVGLEDFGSWFFKTETAGEENEEDVSPKNKVSVLPRYYLS